jgi:hypothetical protein
VPAPSPPACCTRRSDERAFRVADGHAVMSTGRNDAAPAKEQEIKLVPHHEKK